MHTRVVDRPRRPDHRNAIRLGRPPWRQHELADRSDRRPTSIGITGDSYDNAFAEALNGLCKNELIRRRGPWRNAEHFEIETLAHINWFSRQRLRGEINHVSPAVHEADYCDRQRQQITDQTPTLI